MSEFNYDIISQYLAGELVGDDLIAFEKELQTNVTLANEVKLYKTIDNELLLDQQNKAEKENLTKTLNSLSQTHFKKKEVKVVGINKLWWYAATTIAAAAVLFLVFRPTTKIEPFNNEIIYASYVNKNIDELSFGERGKNDSSLSRAASSYNKKDYATALPLLENAVADNPKETQLILAIGVCYMQTNQNDWALRSFDQIAEGKSVYKNKAQWYKALTLLKQNKLTDCKTTLQSIPKDADEYNIATELLNKLPKE